MKKQFLTAFILFNLVLSGFCFAQDDIIKAPETFEEAQQMGEQALEIGKRDLPGIVKELWYGKVLPMWQKMYDWAYVNIWLKVQGFFGPRVEKEIEVRKEIIEQEFEYEKKEVKKELPGLFDKTWQFMRDVIDKIKVLWK